MIDSTARDIREMRTHSSSAVARKAAEALLSIGEREYESVEEFHQALERNSRILRQSNPSHAWLQSSQWDIVDRVTEGNHDTPGAAISLLEDVVRDTVTTIETATEDAATNALELLGDEATILTHDYSTTVLAAIERAIAQDVSLTIYVTESRPRVMGRRMARTVGQLGGVTVTLIVDNAAGIYLEECDRVLFGMDCIVEDTLYNRVGTFPISCVAARLDVPVSVLGASAKIVDGAFTFENEFRDPVEVAREPAPEFTIENPAYDATPIDLIDSIVTENGIEWP